MGSMPGCSRTHPNALRSQVEGVIVFSTDEEPLQHWDAQIQGVCLAVNQIIEGIHKKNYQLASLEAI